MGFWEIAGYIGVLIYLAIIFSTIFDKQGTSDRKERAELIEWYKTTEFKFRDLHTYPEDWGMRRRAIALKFKYICQNCGTRGWLGFHIHHIIHLSQGGTNALENLTYLCKYCHENHHPHMIEERERKYVIREEIRKKTYWKNYWARKGKYKKTT